MRQRCIHIWEEASRLKPVQFHSLLELEEVVPERQLVVEPRAGPVPLPPEQQGNVLLNPLATALNQDDQHDDRKDAGSYTNERYSIHVDSPFLFNEIFVKTFHYGDGRRTQSHQK